MVLKRMFCVSKVYILLVLAITLVPITAGAETYIDEDWESYNIGDFPSAGGWTLGGDQDTYERYAGNHVVAKPSGTGKCMMITNPYNGWGMHLQQHMLWDLTGNEIVHVELEFMYPDTNSHNLGNSVGTQIYEWQLASSCTVQLGTNDDSSDDGLGIFATNGTSSDTITSLPQFDQWVHVVEEINTATLTYNLWIDGTLVGNNLQLNPNVSILDANTFQIDKGFWQSGPGYYDNVQVRVIPEPSAFILVTFSLMALCWRWRMRG